MRNEKAVFCLKSSFITVIYYLEQCKLPGFVIQNLDTGKVIALTLLDLFAAFDTIDYSVLLDRLSDWYGIVGTAFTWISSFLINRIQLIKIGKCFSKAVPLFCSVSQGSLIHSYKLDHHLYADDTQVYISLSTADSDLSLKKRGDCLSDISGWMTNSKLRFHANKTDFIIIGTSRQRSKLTHFFPMNILSHSITPSDMVRNLGVTFDSDFNFRKHISLTSRSCFYHIYNLRRIRQYICPNYYYL